MFQKWLQMNTPHSSGEVCVLPPGELQTNLAKISGGTKNDQLKVQSYTEIDSLIDVVAWGKEKSWSGPFWNSH